MINNGIRLKRGMGSARRWARAGIVPSLALCLLLGSGCARKAEEAKRDIGPEAQAYYKAHPEFFHFSTPADLPKDLVWEDGHDVPEFADPAAKRGGTLHFWIDDFPRTLRFYGLDANGSFRSYILDDNTLSLIGKQPNTNQYYPALAKSWAFGKDGKTMYFKLDPEARYSDGEPVKAGDFLFAFFFFRSAYLNDPWSANYYTEKFSQITKYDDSTISITSSEKRPDLADRIDLAPVPEHFYKELGTDYAERYQWKMEPTTGSYIVKPEDLKKGQSVELTRVPHWWASDKRFFRYTRNFDKIHFDVIRDPDKAFEVFKRGDMDYFGLTLPALWYEKLPDTDPLVQKGCIGKAVFYNQTGRPSYGLWVNTAMPLLDNRDLRVGIAYAANFDLVDKQYFRGDFVRLQTSADGYPEVPFPDIKARTFSVEKALESFAKAGFKDRGPDGILKNSQGQRLSFTITNVYQRLSDVLTILRQEAAKAGLELNIETLDANTAFKKMMEKHHQIGFMAFNLGAEKFPRYWENFHSSNANKPQTNNLTNTADPEMDKWIDEYDKVTTMDEIRALAQKIEERIWENAAFIPAFKQPFYRAGFWRWIQWPNGFDVRSGDLVNYNLCWVDESLKAPTLAALHGGPPLPPLITVYDQWKEK